MSYCGLDEHPADAWRRIRRFLDGLAVPGLMRVSETPLEQWSSGSFVDSEYRRCLLTIAFGWERLAIPVEAANWLDEAAAFDYLAAQWHLPRLVALCRERASLRLVEIGSRLLQEAPPLMICVRSRCPEFGVVEVGRAWLEECGIPCPRPAARLCDRDFELFLTRPEALAIRPSLERCFDHE